MLFVLYIFLNLNRVVEKLINLMTVEFLNPFDDSLDSGDKLHNLSSGIPVSKKCLMRYWVLRK